jgi:hypothetical protein
LHLPNSKESRAHKPPFVSKIALTEPRLVSEGTLIAETITAILLTRRSKEIEAMIMTNKLLPVALVAALIGGSVGAVVMHSRNQPTAETQAATTPGSAAQYAQFQGNAAGQEQFIPAQFNSASEQNAYKSGFADGYQACATGTNNRASTSNLQPVVARSTARSSARSSSSRRVYYDYQQQPKGRSFWSKHRDKLTVAMGTGGGAIIGGLIGGKKGAAIGALSGAGGSALYTYKLRNRSRRY